MQINRVFYNSNLSKNVSFRSNDSDDWYVADFGNDSFESQTKKPKPKKWYINPLAKAKALYYQYIDDAHAEAEEIIANAKKQRDKIIASAKIEAEQEARQVYSKKDDEYWKFHRKKVAELEASYQRKEEELQERQLETQKKLDDVIRATDAINNGRTEEEIKSRKSSIMSYLDSYSLDYDYFKKSTRTIKKYAVKNPVADLSAYEYVPKAKTPETPLLIPEFKSGQDWEFEVPSNDSLTFDRYTRLPFVESYNHETNISMDYANSVNWDENKISRDILQNFFDGHGQTLDGVKISYVALENGRYKVKIEGKAKYSQEKAILLGESTKRDNSKAAGNFGEGLKIAVIKLLSEYGANEVNIASDNWRLVYKPQQSSICQKNVLSYSLLENEQIDGNYIEFETDNEKLLNSLRTSINNFYHSSNVDFQNLDFENDLFGIKILDENKTGSLYIAGQKFEYLNERTYSSGWENLPGATIIFKRKPKNSSILDISRDRIRIRKKDLGNLLHHAMLADETSIDDICQLLKMFEGAWTKENKGIHRRSDEAENIILDSAICASKANGFKFIFPSVYLAGSEDFFDKKEEMYKDSYLICRPEFSKIGMQSVDSKFFEDAPEALVAPTEKEIKKIAIIKKTLACVKPYILKSTYGLKRVNLNPKIYIFEESGIFSGEHTHDGFWISREELKQNFGRVLATALHEICHEYGEDGSVNFTYALTDMLQAILQAATEDYDTLLELKALKSCWEELSKQK